MFGVVYSAATGRVRSFTGAGAAASDLAAIRLGQGEALLQFEDKVYGALPAIQDLVTQATGLTPTNDRYAIVDKTGAVLGSLHADPLAGDAVPGCQLVASATASPGWVWNAQLGFTAPIATSVGKSAQSPPSVN